MELSKLGYYYDIIKKRYAYIQYEFKLSPENFIGMESEEIAEKALEGIVQILDTHYHKKKFQRASIEDKDPIISNIGYNYFPNYRFRDKFNLHKDAHSISILRCILSSKKDSGIEIKVNLNIEDDDSTRLLKIYDTLMSMPGLEFSEAAMCQKNALNTWRYELLSNKDPDAHPSRTTE
jgi:hypothetical protein